MLSVTAVGNLARGPEVKTIGEREVANFTILCNRKTKAGETVTQVDCAVWGPRAQVIADFVVKGMQMTVTGEAYVDKYESKDYGTVAKIVLTVNDFSLPPKSKGEEMPF